VSSKSHRPSSSELSGWVSCPSCRTMGYVASVDESVPERCKPCGGVGYVKLDPKPNADPTQPQGGAE
jgi:hypothetical protein